MVLRGLGMESDYSYDYHMAHCTCSFLWADLADLSSEMGKMDRGYGAHQAPANPRNNGFIDIEVNISLHEKFTLIKDKFH